MRGVNFFFFFPAVFFEWDASDSSDALPQADPSSR